MNNREDIKNFILEIETKFPVNNWKIDNIHFWPLLRISLFMYLRREIETKHEIDSNDVKISIKKLSFNEKLIQIVRNKINKVKSGIYYIKWLYKLPQKNILFVGHDYHRRNLNGERYNIYFDVYIEKYNLENDSMYFEYGSETLSNYKNKNLIYRFNKAFSEYSSFYFKKKHIYNFEGYEGFENFMKENPITNNFGNKIRENTYKNELIDFKKNVDFFKKVLLKIKPKKIFFLCYYSNKYSLMGMITAANQLGIKTIEMQHGPQADAHMCYANWSVVPNEGYDLLPREYWNWDINSQSVLNQWINKNKLYSALLVGNPWIKYWKTNKTIYEYKDIILYCMQPSVVETNLDNLFPENILYLIKNSKYKWFLRLHPRQLKEKEKLVQFLKIKEVYHLVNIDNATNDPLPQLFTNTKIHLTPCSGTAIEADFFDVYTIFIDPIALNYYPELIASKKAEYIDVNDELFITKFLEKLEIPEIINKNPRFNNDLESSELFYK